VNGANCADCETTWPLPSSLCCASRISISGAPRPLLVEGPGWSEPGHVHELVQKKKYGVS